MSARRPSLGDDHVDGGCEYGSDRLRRLRVPFGREPDSAVDAQRQTGRDGIGPRLLCRASGTYRYAARLAGGVRGAFPGCIDKEIQGTSRTSANTNSPRSTTSPTST